MNKRKKIISLSLAALLILTTLLMLLVFLLPNNKVFAEENIEEFSAMDNGIYDNYSYYLI